MPEGYHHLTYEERCLIYAFSHERIYQHVWEYKKNGGTLYVQPLKRQQSERKKLQLFH
jgi:uncharacterized protein (DUF2249 family)